MALTITRHGEWSGKEIEVLRAYYPAGGAKACLPFLPRRTIRAVYAAAADLQIRRVGGRGRRPRS